MNSIIQSISSFPVAGIHPDLKVAVWSLLVGALVALVIFFVINRKNGAGGTQEKPASVFPIFLIVFLVGVVGIGLYLLVMLQSAPDTAPLPPSGPVSGTGSPTVKFPLTGPNPIPQTLIESAKSLYATPLDGLITFSLIISVLFLAVTALRNITMRRKVEKYLKNANTAARSALADLSIEKSKVDMARAKEEAILLSIGDGLLATDEQGRIMLINKTAEKLLGRERSEVIGKLFSSVILAEDETGTPIPLEKHPIHLALAGGTVATTTAGPAYYYVRKDKSAFPVAITVTPVMLEGTVIGAIEVFRDITKEKEIDKAKNEFVSLASHQLRTPLTAISWYAEMILRGDVGAVVPDQQKYLEEIYRGNQRMIELVNTLLDVSRLELGTFVVKPEPTDIRALAFGALDELKPKIERKKLVIARKFSDTIPTILIDPKLLLMVFQNLLSNAVEYTPPGGKIGCAVYLEDKKTIMIEISDTGYGIPKNQQDKIFTKFFRADNVRDKDTDGTGLGLYIVKSIVEKCGGKLWFVSEENHGTIFYVMLPVRIGRTTGRKKGTPTTLTAV